MKVLVINAGGVTLDLAVVDDGVCTDRSLVDPWDGTSTDDIDEVARRASDIDVVGHRVVHGGRWDAPVGIDDDVVADLRAAEALVPVHQGRSIRAIDAARSAVPDRPHVACFDTTFHRSIPDMAATYPLPAEWRSRWSLRRSGYHGLSHRHVADVAPAIAGIDAPRIVSCHLGSGSSLCAIRDGTSVDTTMGMTPLEGLVMVSRSGSVDPGLLLWLLDGRVDLDRLRDGLLRRSGLKGLTGGTGDMRDVLETRARGDADAALAFDVYVHRLRQGIAAMAASMDGLDVLAFTGGVGSNMPTVREAAAAGLRHLGVVVDAEVDARCEHDEDVTGSGAAVRTLVVEAGEHFVIAALAGRVVDGA